MRNITYKYNIGDYVVLKPEHLIYYYIDEDDMTVKITTTKILERRDYNGPAYRFDGVPGFFKEDCIKHKCIDLPEDHVS